MDPEKSQMTDFANMPEAEQVELEKALNTPAVDPATIAKLDADKKATEQGKADAAAEEGNTDNSNDDNTLDVDKTPEQIAEEKRIADEKAAKGDDGKGSESADQLDIIDYNAALKAVDINVEKPITSQAEFAEAIKSNLEVVKTQAKQELFLEVTEMAGYDPETQYLLQMSKAGVPAEELRVPGAGFDEHINSSDEALVAAEMRANNTPEAEIPGLIDQLKEDQKLGAEAKKLRDGLIKDKAAYVERFENQRKAFVEKRLSDLKAKDEKFDNDVVETIKKTDLFLGMKLTDALKDQIAKKFTLDPEYRLQLTTNPKFLANLIMKDILLDRALEKIKKTSTIGAENKVKKENHLKNYNATDIAKQEKGSESSQEGTDGFEAWNVVRTQSVMPAS